MELSCGVKGCSWRYASPLIDKQQALNDVTLRLLDHARAGHPREMYALQSEMQAKIVELTWYLPLSYFAVIPEKEGYLLDKLDSVEKSMAELLGMECVPLGLPETDAAAAVPERLQRKLLDRIKGSRVT